MESYYKYLQYKKKYLALREAFQHHSLQFYHIGMRRFRFSIQPWLDVAEGTGIHFGVWNREWITIIITRPGKVLLLGRDFSVVSIYDLKNEKNFSAEGGEEGLLGISIIGKRVYLSYTIRISEGSTLVISEYEMLNNRLIKLRQIFELSFPTIFHHGGHLVPSHRQTLILGVGDGGPQGDPYNQAQDETSWRGKILEIDPLTLDVTILAKGLRNPWYFSLDSNNRLWIGDVGWNTSESVKVMDNINKFYNFGWSFYEGSVPVPGKLPSSKSIPFSQFDHPESLGSSKLNRLRSLSLRDMNFPVWEYPTSQQTGRCIIGGYYLHLFNIYVFGDYLGIIRAIQFNGNRWEEVANDRLMSDELIYSFAFDGNNIYVLTNKRIYLLSIIPVY